MAIISGNNLSNILRGTNSIDTLLGLGGNDRIFDLGRDDIHNDNFGIATRFWLDADGSRDQILGLYVGSDKILIVDDDFGIGPTLDAAGFTFGAFSGTGP